METTSTPLLTLIVPTYNGAAYVAENVRTIVRTLETLDETFEVLVVCDGSTDGTAVAAGDVADPRVRVLRYKQNRGKGHAICFGIASARGRLVGWLDADLDIEPQAIVAGVQRLEHPEIDAVIGSKRHRDSQVDYPAHRRLLSQGFQLLSRLLLHVNVSDTQVGAKVFRREMLDAVVPLLLIKSYAFDLEVLAVGAQFGFDRVEEMPVQLHYRFTGTSINWRAVQRMFLDTLAIAYRIHLRHWYVRQFAAQQRERIDAQKVSDALASPLASPLPSSLESPPASPLASLLGSPSASPVGSPLGSPSASLVGSPVGSPSASPLASPVGSPSASPLASRSALLSPSPPLTPPSEPQELPTDDTVTDADVGRPDWATIFTERQAALAQRRRLRRGLVLATVFYAGFACYLTWPLVTDLAHSIYGDHGDPYGTMAFYGALAGHHYNPFLPGAISQFSAPEGQAIPWVLDLASAPGVLAIYLLSVLFGATPGYNLYALAGYTLTGVATFLFARRLTSNGWAALIAGWAFAFYPFAVLNGLGHLDNIQGWPFVLAVWRMVELLWHPSRRNGLLAGLAVAFSIWWSPYFILFGGVAYVVATVATLFIAWRNGGLRVVLGPQVIAALVVLVFAAFLGALATVGAAEGTGVRTHNVEELTVYGARPLEYLIPDAQSPLFRGYTRHYLETHLYGSAPIEATLYVGVTVILLALVAFAASVRRRLSPRLGRAVVVLWLIAVAGFITSMPPEVQILGASIPTPSHFIAQVTTTWRVYSRFVMIVMLALSVLAAVGLDVLARRRSKWGKIVVMSLATVLVPLDLWSAQHSYVTKISTPGIYRTLARQPKGLVAEYPLSSTGGSDYNALFYQQIYDMPLINGYLANSFEENRAFSLAYLGYPFTAPDLAALGVRYVLVNTGLSRVEGWPPAGTPGAGFRLIAHESDVNLYVVTARPKSLVIPAAGEGFVPVALEATGSVTRLEGSSGTIELTGSCASCEGVLSFTLTSKRQVRRVTIFNENGEALVHRIVAGPTPAKISLRFARHTSVRLTTTSGPRPTSTAPGGPKTGVFMTNLEFTETASATGRGPARGSTNGKAT